MNTKPVLLVIAVVAALAVSAGGAFAGGIALGKSQANDAAEATVAADTQATGGTGALDLDALRQQFQSGDFDPEAFAQLQEQFLPTSTGRSSRLTACRRTTSAVRTPTGRRK